MVWFQIYVLLRIDLRVQLWLKIVVIDIHTSWIDFVVFIFIVGREKHVICGARSPPHVFINVKLVLRVVVQLHWVVLARNLKLITRKYIFVLLSLLFIGIFGIRLNKFFRTLTTNFYIKCNCFIIDERFGIHKFLFWFWNINFIVCFWWIKIKIRITIKISTFHFGTIAIASIILNNFSLVIVIVPYNKFHVHDYIPKLALQGGGNPQDHVVRVIGLVEYLAQNKCHAHQILEGIEQVFVDGCFIE